MSKIDELDLEDISKKYKLYKEGAYTFMLHALDYTEKAVTDKVASIADIIIYTLELSIREYGPLALLVLNYWGIKKTIDFGKILDHLINEEYLMSFNKIDLEKYDVKLELKDVLINDYRAWINEEVKKIKKFGV